MTLLRAAARTLLASQFVVSGFKAVKNPQPLVPAAQPVVDQWLPVLQKYAPDQVTDVIPTDTATLVRINGALELVGGLALASGKGRRLGSALLAISLVPSTVAKYPFWTRTLPDDKAKDRELFLKNVSLLGSVLLAARDTEGKPSLAWCAQAGGAAIAKDTQKAGKRVAKNTQEITDAALSSGAVLVGAAVAQTRKARKRANKELKKSRAAAAARAEQARKIAAKQEKKDTKVAVKQDLKAEKQNQKAIAKAENIAAKQHAKEQLKAEKKAARLDKHIKRGEN
jgi:uncharacterized membrane protein YphA (DoxX/SURF4 family)